MISKVDILRLASLAGFKLEKDNTYTQKLGLKIIANGDISEELDMFARLIKEEVDLVSL